jgi:poly-beta-hydroxyalkanoate depolymerase
MGAGLLSPDPECLVPRSTMLIGGHLDTSNNPSVWGM